MESHPLRHVIVVSGLTYLAEPRKMLEWFLPTERRGTPEGMPHLLGSPLHLSGLRGPVRQSSVTKAVRTIVQYGREAVVRALEDQQPRLDRRGLLAFLFG